MAGKKLRKAATTEISKEEAELLSKELLCVREEVKDDPYLAEALKVLSVKGYRSAIGAYWNAVVDDLRNKIIHRSLDLFNKEVRPKKEIKKYEDFQDHVTEHDLIEGAYKIGVLSRDNEDTHNSPKIYYSGIMRIMRTPIILRKFTERPQK